MVFCKNNQTLRKSGGSVALFFRSECEVLFEHLFHSAVHYCQGVYGILPFVFGAVYRLFHESALFKAGIVMDGKIILEQEAAVADISHLADEPELLAYRVDGNASEIPYRIDKCFRSFSGENTIVEQIYALLFSGVQEWLSVLPTTGYLNPRALSS